MSREECELMKVFETKALERILRPKRNKGLGGLRKLPNAEDHDLSSPNMIRKIK
jgi:hypothetical protein